MGGESEPRTGRFGAIVVAVVVGGSALAVAGWHLLAGRDGGRLDTSGFDMSAAPENAPNPPAPAFFPPSNAAPRAPESAGSSLGFVKGGDYFQDASAAAPRISTPPAAAAAPEPAPAKTAADKGVKKTFQAPRLKGVGGIHTFGSSPLPTGGQGAEPAPPQAAGKDGGSIQDALKNLPPDAANNPEIQKLLKNQGK